MNIQPANFVKVLASVTGQVGIDHGVAHFDHGTSADLNAVFQFHKNLVKSLSYMLFLLESMRPALSNEFSANLKRRRAKFAMHKEHSNLYEP